MVWSKIDDKFLDNPKVDAAGPLAEHLLLRAIIHCNCNETDGLVTKTALSKIGFGLPKIPERVNALLSAGLWTVNEGGGWWIHDFLEYNPSKASLKAKRAKETERQRKYRATGDVSQRDNARDNVVTYAWPRSGREVVDEKREEEPREKAKPPKRNEGESLIEYAKRTGDLGAREAGA